jgi:hypothetical protein
MSKLTVSYNTVTVESTLAKKDLITAQKYAPNSDVLCDDKENPVFKIGYAKEGSVGQYGVTFDATTPEGKMFHSFKDSGMPENTTDRKAYLQDKFGSVLFALNAVETQVNAALAARAGQIAEVADSIIVG